MYSQFKSGQERPRALRFQASSLILIAALVASMTPAVSAENGTSMFSHAHVTALAVDQTSQGYVGVHTDVDVTVLAHGAGNVYVSTKPLAQADMQGSARLASQVAATTLGVDWDQQDYLVSFTSNTTVIGGPSAGADMTLAFTTALHNLLNAQSPWTLDPTVAVTGTINPDGTIGPVGGVPAKAEGAAQAGIQTFLYPAGLDRATTLQGNRVVTVDMASHCKDLGITCRSATTIGDVLAAAAHVSITPPPAPVPSTTDYASALSPGVQKQVADLQSRIDAIPGLPGYAQLTTSAKSQVSAAQTEAQADLDAANAAVAASQFYSAATQTFKGAIATGYAENLLKFYHNSRAESVVTDAIAACQKASNAAQASVNGTSVTTLNALYAVGAAQERAGETSVALQQAQAYHDNAYTYSGWLQSLQESSFCAERANTVQWWASLPSLFAAGPVVTDMTSLAQDETDQATELVNYATSVLSGGGGGGTDPYLQQAQDKLTQAQTDQTDRPAASIIEAAEAQTLASAAVQLGGGASVPASVLTAAQQGAAQAIARARGAGAEPVLSVSLVELAQGAQDSGTALQEYWNARNLALLDLPQTGTAPTFTSNGVLPAKNPAPIQSAGAAGSSTSGNALNSVAKSTAWPGWAPWLGGAVLAVVLAAMLVLLLRRRGMGHDLAVVNQMAASHFEARRNPAMAGPDAKPEAVAAVPEASNGFDWIQIPDPFDAAPAARPRDPATGRWLKRQP